jgi:hypothetical protein
MSTLLAQGTGPTGSDPLDTLINTGEPAYAGATGAYVQTSIPLTVAKVANTVISLMGVIFLALTVYAGFLYMTSQGDEKAIDKAKKILTGAVIGLGLMLASYSITKFVTASLLKAT